MKQTRFFSFIIVVTVCFNSCKKDPLPYKLRNYEGNYWFGAAIDKKPFTLRSSYDFFSQMPLFETTMRQEPMQFRWTLTIKMNSYYPDNSDRQSLILTIRDFKGVGRYGLSDTTYGAYEFYSYTRADQFFKTNSNGDGGYVEVRQWRDHARYDIVFNYRCRDTSRPGSSCLVEGMIQRK